MAQEQPSPGSLSTAPSVRRPISSYLLFAGAGCLLLIAGILATAAWKPGSV
jgi:hypothetical protein